MKRYVLISRDVTHRKLIEEESEKLKIHSEKSDRFNELLLHTIPFGMDIVDMEGTVLFQNDHMKKFVREDNFDRTYWEMYRDDGTQCDNCSLRHEFTEGRAIMLNDDGVFGGRSYEMFHIGMVFKEQKAILEIFIDVTERRRSEAALKESQFFFQESQRAANLGSYKADFSSKAGLSSATWESSDVLDKIFGIDKDFVRSIENWLDIIHPEDRDMMQAYLQEEVIGKRKVFDKEYRIVLRESGETRWLLGLGKVELDAMGNVTCLMGTIQDITDRKKSEERLEETMRQLKVSLLGTIDVISQIVDMRDPYTAEHQRKVSVLSGKIAERMGLQEDRIAELQMAALIHDIGKISVAAEILSKPSKLKTSEFDLVRDHVQSGYDALKYSGLSDIVKRGVFEHHERLDGSGYPQRLKGEEISLEARILSVADVVDAMSSHRPYRASLGIDAAMVEIRQFRGIRYDPDVVDACWQVLMEERTKPKADIGTV